MNYCAAKMQISAEEFIFRAYLTESAMILTENTQRFAGGNRMGKHWTDVVDVRPKSQRSGDEIAADVIARLGLKVIGGDANGV